MKQTKVEFNSSEHYKNAILYFNELSKQRKTDVQVMSREDFNRQQQRFIQAMSTAQNPHQEATARQGLFQLMTTYAMQSSDVQEFGDYLGYVQQLTEKAFLPEDERPGLLSFPFINKTTLTAILRRFVPNAPDDANQKDIIKLMSLPGLDGENQFQPVCIQTRDVNDWDEIQDLVDYIEQHLDDFCQEEEIDQVITWDHGGYGDQDPNVIRHLRGRYIYIGDPGDPKDYTKVIDLNKLLDILKPYMSDEKYHHYQTLVNQMPKNDAEEVTSGVGGIRFK